MMTMSASEFRPRTVHVALYDSVADWEIALLLTELRTGRFTGMARAGLLDGRRHTSAAPEYLAASGYAGAARYVNERAVADDGLVTAGPQSPVHFARATLGCLGLASGRTLQAYEDVFHRGDACAYPVLMQAAGAA